MLNIQFQYQKPVFDILTNIQYHDNHNYLGKFCEVLVENSLEDQEKYFGRTSYMKPVIFESNKCFPGEIVKVKINSFNRNNLFGQHNIDKIRAA